MNGYDPHKDDHPEVQIVMLAFVFILAAIATVIVLARRSFG